MNNDKYYFIHVCNFISKIMRKLKLPTTICTHFNDLYHSHVEHCLLPLFNKTYNNLNVIHSANRPNTSNIIWIFWWQGKKDMPKIVQVCLKSIKKHSYYHKVILITKNNIHKFTNIPKYIYKKFYKHEITITHFSDILRFNLLKNYGGLWIDSTMYCTSNIHIKFNNRNTFYTASGGYIDKYHFFISSKWTGFLIGGVKNNPVFVFMSNFFDLYWKRNTKLIDYFLIDYALNYCYIRNIGGFKDYCKYSSYKNNRHLHDLLKLLNKPFNTQIYDKLIRNNNLFKLTYKMHFRKGNTFYNKLIRNNK